jgi:hypothetical protein
MPACPSLWKKIGFRRTVALSLQLNMTHKIARALARFLKAYVLALLAGRMGSPGRGRAAVGQWGPGGEMFATGMDNSSRPSSISRP